MLEIPRALQNFHSFVHFHSKKVSGLEYFHSKNMVVKALCVILAYFFLGVKMFTNSGHIELHILDPSENDWTGSIYVI